MKKDNLTCFKHFNEKFMLNCICKEILCKVCLSEHYHENIVLAPLLKNEKIENADFTEIKNLLMNATKIETTENYQIKEYINEIINNKYSEDNYKYIFPQFKNLSKIQQKLKKICFMSEELIEKDLLNMKNNLKEKRNEEQKIISNKTIKQKKESDEKNIKESKVKNNKENLNILSNKNNKSPSSKLTAFNLNTTLKLSNITTPKTPNTKIKSKLNPNINLSNIPRNFNPQISEKISNEIEPNTNKYFNIICITCRDLFSVLKDNAYLIRRCNICTANFN